MHGTVALVKRRCHDATACNAVQRHYRMQPCAVTPLHARLCPIRHCMHGCAL